MGSPDAASSQSHAPGSGEVWGRGAGEVALLSPWAQLPSPQGDGSPMPWLRELLSSSWTPSPPAASQGHQVSRFTCRASPSAQEPRAGSLSCPEPAPSPVATSPESAAQGLLQGSPYFTAQPGPWLSYTYFCSLLIRYHVCCAHTRVRNAN